MVHDLMAFVGLHLALFSEVDFFPNIKIGMWLLALLLMVRQIEEICMEKTKSWFRSP